LLTRTLNVRGTLCQINALKHTLRLFREATNFPVTDWDNFMQDFAHFRQSWFDLGSDRVDRLRVYLVQSIAMLYEVMDTYSRALSSETWFQRDDRRANVYFLASGMHTGFVNQWDPESALAYTLSEWRRSRRLILDLPVAFAEPLRSYLDQEGLLSAHVKRHFWPSHCISPSRWRREIMNAAAQHVYARNSHVDFLFRNGLLWTDANYSSLGLWPHILTDRSVRGHLRRQYHRLRKWGEVAKICMKGSGCSNSCESEPDLGEEHPSGSP